MHRNTLTEKTEAVPLLGYSLVSPSPNFFSKVLTLPILRALLLFFSQPLRMYPRVPPLIKKLKNLI